MELEQPSPASGGSGCRVKLSSYGSRERVELHVELENRSQRALSLALGSFTAGSSSSCILSASLQSCLERAQEDSISEEVYQGHSLGTTGLLNFRYPHIMYTGSTNLHVQFLLAPPSSVAP